MLHIFGDNMGAEINSYLFDPVIRNTAERTRWMNKQFDEVRAFTGSDGKTSKLTKAESKYTHMLLDMEGYAAKVEGSLNRENLISASENLKRKLQKGLKDEGITTAAREEAREFGLSSEETGWIIKYAQFQAETENAGKAGSKIDTVKCENARAKYRALFDDYYDAVVDLLVAHGEAPIGKIDFYAPHMTTNDKVNLLNGLLERLGVNESATELPAEIAGTTEDLRPNKRWTPFFQHRTTEKTSYDIVGAFESYVSYLSDVIFHIDDIRKLRFAEEFLRNGTAGDYTNALETAIDFARSADYDAKEDFLREIGTTDPDAGLSNEEIDQALDDLISELVREEKNKTRYSKLVDWLKTYTDILAGKQFSGDRGLEHLIGRVGPESKGLNALNQGNTVFATSKVAANISTVLNQSAQLPLMISTRSQRAIWQAVSEFASGKLRDFIHESDFLTGKNGTEYISKGVYDNILEKMFIGAEFTDKTLSTIAARAAYLDAIAGRKGLKQMDHEAAMRFADNYARSLMGDRTKGAKPNAFNTKNPLTRMVNTFQIEALNSWEFIAQDIPRDFRRIQAEHGKVTAAKALVGVIIKSLLGAFILNRITEEAYGGTPAPFDLIGLSTNFIASGHGLSTNDYIRDLFNKISMALFGTLAFDDVPEKKEEFQWSQAVDDTWENVLNDVPLVQNVAALLNIGDESLPMPDLWNKGKKLYSSIKENSSSEEIGMRALELAAELIPGGNQAQKTIKGIRAVRDGGRMNGFGDDERLQYATDDSFLNSARQILFGTNSTPEARAFYASGRSGLTVEQTALWKELREDGADGKNLYELIQTIRGIGNDQELTSGERSAAKRRLINQSELTDSQKAQVYSVMIGDGRDDDFAEMMEAGMSWAAIMEAYEKYKELYDDEELSANEQQTEMAFWIEKQGYSAEQREIVKDAFKFCGIVAANSDKFDGYVAAGMTPEQAKATITQTKKNANGETITTGDKIEAILAQKLSEKKTYAALETAMNEKSYEKLTTAYQAGIPCSTYYAFYTMARDASSDRDENGKEIKGQRRKDKIIAYIDSLNLSARQKDVLMLLEYEKADPGEMPWNSGVDWAGK